MMRAGKDHRETAMPLIAFGPRKDTPRPGMPIALMSAFAQALHTLDGTICIKLRKDT